MSNANVYAAFEHSFAINAARPALEIDAGRSCTYAELDRETARCAAALRALGLQRGDRVAVQVEKSPQALFLYLACLRAGLVFVPLNTALYAWRASVLLVRCRTGAGGVYPIGEGGVTTSCCEPRSEGTDPTLDT